MKLKKLLASILCVAMVLSTMSFTTFANATVNEVTDIAGLKSAIGADGEVKLGASIEMTDPLMISGGKTITLDLNGYTLKGMVGVMVDNATTISTLTVKDSSTNADGKIEGGVMVSGVLNLESGTITGGGFSVYNATIACWPSSWNYPVVNVTGGNIIYTGTEGAAIYGAANNGRVSDLTIGGEVVIESTAACIEQGDAYSSGGTTTITAGSFTSGEGFDVIVTDADNDTVVTGGTYSAAIPDAYLADGFVIEANEDGNYGVINTNAAIVGDTYYATLQEALKAITAENNVVEIVNDITITEKWDNRNTGAKITVPVTINGNGHTLKFTNVINDGYNYLSVFRFEDAATVNELTIDLSEAISEFGGRFRAISAKSDITINDCTFIGSTTYNNTRAVIFGEGAGENVGNINVSVTGSTFENWKRGLGDNENGQDVKTVTATENTFTNASVSVSAKEEIVFTDNTVSSGDVMITSYADVTELEVTANGNTLDETAKNYIEAKEIVTDSEVFDLPVADIDGKVYASLASAVKSVVAGESATIKITDNVSDENVTVNGNVTIVDGAASTYALRSNATTLNNVIFTVESGASLSLDGFNVTGLSYIYAKTPDSISVTNCDIDVTTVEVSGTNCPPGFILFSSNNGGSVEFTFTNNTLLATPDATEDWYTYSHGIAGWNSIESATITGNTFGSTEAPLGAAAVKLMNFVDGAEVTVSENTFYVNSKDSTWGPDAIQFYQNNSRANNYTATINDNDFYVDDATAAIGINTNAMGKPVDYAGGGHVAIGSDNTVNGEAISISDVIVFGNGINDEAYTRGYVGVGVEFDANGKIIGGEFSEYSLGLEDALADGYATETDVAGNLNIVEETLLVNEIKVEFEPAGGAEGEKVYNINLTAGGDVINRLNSADLTFLFSQIEGNNEYEIIASNSEVAINPVDNSKVRYEFHYNGKTDVATDTNATITLGQVKFTGYGKFSFAVDADANGTNAAHATKLFDNIVDTFVPSGVLADGTTVGKLDVTDNTITDVVIAVPTRTLTINLDFPNAINGNDAAYQDMKVEITGTIDGVNKTVTYNLGDTTNGGYVVTNEELVLNNAYTVTVSGAGYRTARYTVTMTDDKQLNFWNNVMDEAQVVEIGKDSSVAKVTFLAGDIVKDNNINIYDLSAVVSYFGTTTDVSAYSDYAKYDLNRDGVIDSKDVAYVLVSWNN